MSGPFAVPCVCQAAELVTNNLVDYAAHMQKIRLYLEERLKVRANQSSDVVSGPLSGAFLVLLQVFEILVSTVKIQSHDQEKEKKDSCFCAGCF